MRDAGPQRGTHRDHAHQLTGNLRVCEGKRNGFEGLAAERQRERWFLEWNELAGNRPRGDLVRDR